MNIREIRKGLGLSQRQMAEQMGLSGSGRHNLSNIENGHRPLSPGLRARAALVAIDHTLRKRDETPLCIIAEVSDIVHEALHSG